MAKFVKKVFTSNGSWTAPSGVTQVYLLGSGGGGGGGTSSGTYGGGGGGGAWPIGCWVSVTPNTSYSITIGAGGTSANDGNDTTFGSLATFTGASKGLTGQNNAASGGSHIRGAFLPTAGMPYRFRYAASFGGIGGFQTGSSDAYLGTNGMHSVNGYSGGTRGTAATTHLGGGGGGAGGQGAGGNGGNGNDSGVGGTGSSASNNTGAGGGGAGAGTSNGTGGSGGSGYLYVLWVE